LTWLRSGCNPVYQAAVEVAYASPDLVALGVEEDEGRGHLEAQAPAHLPPYRFQIIEPDHL